MKKALSLILAVMMLLGCMSVTAFAVDVNVKVGGTNVTSAGELDKTTFTAIKDGTVTYTMPTDTEPAKLTLNNAKIEVESQYALYSNVDLVVELIGNNEIKTEFVGSIQSGGKLTITGSGNLKINSYSHAIRGNKGLNLNMTGSLTAVGSDSSLYTRGNDISVAENAGRIYLTVSNDSKVAVNSEDGGALNIPNVFKVLGSVNCNEEEANLAEALVDGIKVKVNDTEAKTVLIYKPAGTTTDNSTDITLTVAKALTYDMVIPEDVTNLNAAGVHSVGQAKVTNVKNATEKTVISYTAATTAFKCEGKTDIPASYYTDEAGQNTFPTTAVEVYKNKKDAASIPTMWVKITEDAWNAAENGTYTATVTFNFTAKDTVTIADILPNDFPIVNEEQIEGLAWMDNERNKYAYIPLDDQDYIYIQPVNDEQVEIYIELDYVFNNEVYQCVKTDDNYVTTDGYKGYKYTITFNVDQNTGKFNSFEIYEEFYDLGELLTFDTVTYSAQNY